MEDQPSTASSTGSIANPASQVTGSASVIRIGVIGTDSSHLPEFARRIDALNRAGETRCRVTQMWTDGHHHMPADEVAGWRQSALDLGVAEVNTVDELLAESDGVMVLSVHGDQHLEHARPALVRGLPTYVDKPLTCTAADARALAQLARDGGARCYSASSLRFARELESLKPEGATRAALGDLHAIDAYGPGELNAALPRLFFYAIHTLEMVDALWGPGVAAVRAEASEERDLMALRYRDGRFAQLRMERAGHYAFGATVHGAQATHYFEVDFDGVYDRLVAGMVGFFAGGAAPASLPDLVENIATLEAAHRSLAIGGDWVEVPEGFPSA